MSSDRRYPIALARTRNRTVDALAGVSRVERALWTLVGVALVADLATTYYGLRLGLRESNPVARTAMQRFGFGAMVGLKLLAVGVGVGCRRLLAGRPGLIVPAALAVPWLAAALVNLTLYAMAA
ncbi:DUF5658 family protein [Halorussus halobius]|uniref:DUF5658 family protein n=1 Tax=Halorussus halobius TaxID=1710537 RepID=UPI001FCF08FF|nr:DUF5658 family protein [Halorussus halobius]